jgi:hypothetical protein
MSSSIAFNSDNRSSARVRRVRNSATVSIGAGNGYTRAASAADAGGAQKGMSMIDCEKGMNIDVSPLLLALADEVIE